MNLCLRVQFMVSTKRMYRKYLEDVTAKVDAGQYQTTLNSVLTGLTPENVLKAHEMMEAQSHIGKLVIEIVE